MDVASLLAKAREVFPNEAIAVVHVSKRDVSTGKKSEQVAIETAKRTYAFGSMDDAARALTLCIDLVPGATIPATHEHAPVAPVTPSEPSPDPPLESADAAAPTPPLQSPSNAKSGEVRAQIAGRAPLLSI